MSLRKSGAATGLAALAMIAAGCCVSEQQAANMRTAMQEKNRAASEPDMRQAAERRGATLLPLTVQQLRLESCPSAETALLPPFPDPPDFPSPDPRAGCVKWASDLKSFHIVRDGERPKLGVPVDPIGSPYARVARRANKLFVLEPRLSRVKADEATQCQCDAMPHPVVTFRFAFVMDDIEAPEIEKVTVPMTEAFIAWKCRELLATRGPWPREMFASCGAGAPRSGTGE